MAHEFKGMARALIELNVEDLKAIKLSKTEPAIKVWIAAVALKAIAKGESGHLNPILDRIYGKAAERLQIDATIREKPATKADLINALKRDAFIEVPIEDVKETPHD